MISLFVLFQGCALDFQGSRFDKTSIQSSLSLPDPGDLDLTFGTNGKLRLEIPSATAYGLYYSTQQSDGRIIAVGYATFSGQQDSLTVRFNIDGTPDTSFNGTGYRVVPLQPGTDDFFAGVTVHTDGTIVASGSVANANGDISLVRFLSDGSLDTSFDSDGIVVTAGAGNFYDAGYAVNVQSDGKILVGGYIYSGGYKSALLRYNTGGSLDATFGTGGIVLFNPGSGASYIDTFKVQGDGKIVVLGLHRPGSYYSDLMVGRFNADGTADTSFNTTGTRLIVFGTAQNISATGLVVLSDGKIVVAGSALDGADTDGFIRKFNQNGSNDASFATAGVFSFDEGGTENLSGLALASDGKFFATGEVGGASVVIRVDAAGALDSSFGTAGKVTIDEDPGSSEILGLIHIQSDGRVVALGTTSGTTQWIYGFRLWP